ncbi:MAG: hypothetical protein R2706_04970 [Acidimicrobiales bacterium]
MAEAANDPLARLAASRYGMRGSGMGAVRVGTVGSSAVPQTPVVATASQLHETIGVEVRSIAALGQLPLVERRGIPTASLELAVISLAYLISERSLHDLIDQVIRRPADNVGAAGAGDRALSTAGAGWLRHARPYRGGAGRRGFGAALHLESRR